MTKITKNGLSIIEPYDFCVIDNEIIIFYYDGADDVLGNTMTFQDSENYENTPENLQVVMEYFVEMKNYHLKCNNCNCKEFDKETIIQHWLATDPTQPPHDIFFICDDCHNIRVEQRGIVSRGYNDEEMGTK